jgi:hypothetical protein
VFWAERVMPHKIIRCPPYFAITRTHPILPFNISEATYFQSPSTSLLLLTNLIARHAIALQNRLINAEKPHSKVYWAQLKAAHWCKQKHHTVKDFNFDQGRLVLMCNTQVKKSLNCKMCPQYIGLLIIISCNFGGGYISIAAFWPYLISC